MCCKCKIALIVTSNIIKRSNNMKNNETLITAEGLEELKNELEFLKLVKKN